jgi:hypothetical protein
MLGRVVKLELTSPRAWHIGVMANNKILLISNQFLTRLTQLGAKLTNEPLSADFEKGLH